MTRGHHLHTHLVPGAGPKYNQIHEYLRGQIERQKLVNGEYLPPENQLAADFRVSIGTIKKALRLLKAENYVQRRKGDGTRVSFASSCVRDRRSVAVLLGDIARSFYAEIYGGIQKELDARGYKPVLLDTESSVEKERDYINRYGSLIGGLLVVPVGGSRNHAGFGQLLADEVPFVLIDRYLPEFNVDAVVSDNVGGGYLATRHLLELGHRRIAVVGATRTTSMLGRVDGYRRALAEAGLPFDESLVFPSEGGGYERGYQLAERLVSGRPGITAAFCLRDDTAWGCLQRLSEVGVRVPDQMSIIGYDDNEDICGRTRPRLTTIRQSKEEMGATAARMLIEKLGQHTPKRPEIRFLPVALIERESAAPCPGHARKRRMEMAAKGLATRHS